MGLSIYMVWRQGASKACQPHIPNDDEFEGIVGVAQAVGDRISSLFGADVGLQVCLVGSSCP
jgi:hypothetical protein